MVAVRFDQRVRRQAPGENMEKEIEKLTNEMSKLCSGKNSAVVVGASLNMIQSCMTYGGAKFQRACAEMLRGMASMQLAAIGKPKN